MAGGRFISHPSQTARWMGHPFGCGCREKDNGRSLRDDKQKGRGRGKGNDKGNGCAGGRFTSTPFAKREGRAPGTRWRSGFLHFAVHDEAVNGFGRNDGSLVGLRKRKAAGGRFTSHPSQSRDGCGTRFVVAAGRKTRQKQIPFRDDNKKAKATARTKATAFAHHRLEWSPLLVFGL